MRIERKFYFSKTHLNELLSDLKSICTKINKYEVESIYFDNFHEDSYLQKVNGDKDKIKIRARYYNNSKSLINVEAKIKFSDKSYKLTSKISADDLNSLTTKNYLPINKKSTNDLRAIYFYYKYYGFQENIKIQYKRYEMILNAYKKTRLTVDFDVYSSLSKTTQPINTIRCINNNKCVFEVKTEDSYVDGFLGFLIKKYSMKKDAISKYAMGVQVQKENMTRRG